MEKIWLKSYPPGWPAEITWNQYPSVGALVANNLYLRGVSLRS